MVFSFLSSKKRVQSKSNKRVSHRQRNRTSKRRVNRRSQRGGFQADLASAYPAGTPGKKEAFEEMEGGEDMEGGMDMDMDSFKGHKDAEPMTEGPDARQLKGGMGKGAPASKGGMGKGAPASKGGMGKGAPASKGGMGKGAPASKGGVRRKNRSGRKSYATVPVLTAAALSAAHFYGPGSKSRKNRRKSSKSRTQRRK